MGASGWNYVVEYQPDLSRALQELRQREFEAGRYYKPAEFMSRVLDLGIVEAELRPSIEEAIAGRGALTAPRTIAELQEQNAEEGTHSILDIERISEGPAFGAASPLAPAQLLEVFGTHRPSLEAVLHEARAGGLGDKRGGWAGLYVIAYTWDEPSHIFFCGFSGD